MSVLFMEKSVISALSEDDIKKIIDANTAGTKYEDLKNYYVGKHSILNLTKKDSTAPNNKLVNNMAKYITDTAVGYFLGKPVVYSSEDDDLMTKVQEIFDYNDEQDQNTELAKMDSIYGSGFEMLYMDEEAKIRLARVDPADLIMIYETGYSSPAAAIRIIHSKSKNGKSKLKAEFWDSENVWRFEEQGNGKLELVAIEEHYWGDVPFVEYINNEERIGDFEGIVSLIDAYNKVQSNTANLFQYNDEAILKISRLGDVSSQDVADMKEKGAIILEDGGDIDWLIKNFSDEALENYKKRLREDMHIFSNIPNMTDQSFGENLSGVAVSYKLWGLEQICAIKERKFKKALQRRIELITHILNIQGGSYNYMDVDIQFRRNKPQNILEIAQIMGLLANDLSRESRLKMLPTIDNVQDELDKLRDEKKEDIADYGGMTSFVKHFDLADQPEEDMADEYKG